MPMPAERTVFVTSHGRRYHDPDQHRMTGSSSVYLSEILARRAGYVPCSRCFPEAEPARPRPGRGPSPEFLALAASARRRVPVSTGRFR